MKRFGLVAAIVLLFACKGKDKAAGAQAVDLDKRCAQLAKACGESEKHVAKIEEGCKAAKKSGCDDKAVAAHDCYEKELCGKGDKIWAFEDFGVLAERHSKCVAERNAAKDCVAK